MSLSDCMYCWDTPCVCGWEYRNWSSEAIQKHIKLFHKLLKFKLEHPGAKYSFCTTKLTEDEIEFMKVIGIHK